MRIGWTLALCTAVLLFPGVARGQITPIGPFTGSHFDNFNSYGGGGGGHAQLDIFNNFCLVRNTTQGGSLKIEFSSERGGDLVVPRSSPTMMGQLGISEWTFDFPIYQYGGWFENNSRFDDATVEFYDVNANLIGSVNATIPRLAQTWTWNGWQSTVPIKTVKIIGNDVLFLNGFIWWEDFNVTIAAIPEPSTYVLLGLTALVGVGVYYYRRKRTTESPDLV
jgi:hypothetical protein